MKKIIILLILLVNIHVYAHDHSKEKGIRFFQGSFKELLKEAKKQNKTVFIDFYTKWCGPCKVMAKGTFTKSEVGDFYNKNFICYKVDAEIGEGPELAKEYGIKGFPTLVFVNNEGKTVIDNAVGAKTVEQLINLGRKALGEDIKDFAWYQGEYEKGNRNAEFLKKYHQIRLEEQNIQINEVEAWDLYQAYSEEQKWQPDAIEMVFWKAKVGNKFYELVKNNKDKFPGLTKEVIHIRWFHQVAKHPEQKKEENNLKQVAKDFPKFANQALELYEIEEWRMQSKFAEYIPKIIAYAKKYGEPLDFNLMLMTTVTKAKSVKPEDALFASKYFKQIINQDTTHFYTMSGYAYCLYIAGKKKEAQAFVKKYRSLTDQYEGNKKMKWCYDTMIKIEKGEQLKRFTFPN
jgi:thiol-disulfide isomerase/thioredoxin